jgi:hypothetical protein
MGKDKSKLGRECPLPMNDKYNNDRKTGEMKKEFTDLSLEFEKLVKSESTKLGLESAYDVVANEMPCFKTINYTEYAGGFILHPLQLEFRVSQMIEAFYDKDSQTSNIDYIAHLGEKVRGKKSNKYVNIDTKNVRRPPAEVLIVLPGSNRLDKVSSAKLKYIKNSHNDVLVKPHPITTFRKVGEVMDLFGEEKVLHKSEDMYGYLLEADIIYTSMLSESVAYAVALGKRVEPIDKYHDTPRGSFYHINRFLFHESDPSEWLQTTFNSYKSGVIYPDIDDSWRQKVIDYLGFINDKRKKYSNKYIKDK